MNKFEKWAYYLVSGIIGGGATSLFAGLGLVGAKASGIDVPTMNFKAMGVIFLSGAITNAVAYLMKSPLPPINGDTSFLSKPPTPPQNPT